MKGEDLKFWRKARGLKLKDVAISTKKTESYISRLENNSSTPSLQMKKILRDTLKLPKDLFTDEENAIFNEMDKEIQNNTLEKNNTIDLFDYMNSDQLLYKGKPVSLTTIEKIIKLLEETKKK